MIEVRNITYEPNSAEDLPKAATIKGPFVSRVAIAEKIGANARVSSFEYRVDGGPWLPASVEKVLIFTPKVNTLTLPNTSKYAAINKQSSTRKLVDGIIERSQAEGFNLSAEEVDILVVAVHNRLDALLKRHKELGVKVAARDIDRMALRIKDHLFDEYNRKCPDTRGS